VDVDLVTICEPVRVRVLVERIGLVGVDLVTVDEAVFVGVIVERVGLGCVDFFKGIVPDDVLAKHTVPWRQARWRGYLTDTQPIGRLLAEIDGEVVGFVAWGPGREDPRPELMALYVHPDRWGSGAGRALMLAAEDGLRQRGDGACLWVLADNPRARRFYERAGWAPDGGEKWEDFGSRELLELRYARTW
jgi:GNAT superfamily N-acetyltransferase